LGLAHVDDQAHAVLESSPVGREVGERVPPGARVPVDGPSGQLRLLVATRGVEVAGADELDLGARLRGLGGLLFLALPVVRALLVLLPGGGGLRARGQGASWIVGGDVVTQVADRRVGEEGGSREEHADDEQDQPGGAATRRVCLAQAGGHPAVRRARVAAAQVWLVVIGIGGRGAGAVAAVGVRGHAGPVVGGGGLVNGQGGPFGSPGARGRCGRADRSSTDRGVSGLALGLAGSFVSAGRSTGGRASRYRTCRGVGHDLRGPRRQLTGELAGCLGPGGRVEVQAEHGPAQRVEVARNTTHYL